jgi:hypothetical protein
MNNMIKSISAVLIISTFAVMTFGSLNASASSATIGQQMVNDAVANKPKEIINYADLPLSPSVGKVEKITENGYVQGFACTPVRPDNQFAPVYKLDYSLIVNGFNATNASFLTKLRPDLEKTNPECGKGNYIGFEVLMPRVLQNSQTYELEIFASNFEKPHCTATYDFCFEALPYNRGDLLISSIGKLSYQYCKYDCNKELCTDVNNAKDCICPIGTEEVFSKKLCVAIAPIKCSTDASIVNGFCKCPTGLTDNTFKCVKPVKPGILEKTSGIMGVVMTGVMVAAGIGIVASILPKKKSSTNKIKKSEKNCQKPISGNKLDQYKSQNISNCESKSEIKKEVKKETPKPKVKKPKSKPESKEPPYKTTEQMKNLKEKMIQNQRTDQQMNRQIIPKF